MTDINLWTSAALGLLLKHLPEARGVAVDFSHTMLDRLGRDPG